MESFEYRGKIRGFLRSGWKGVRGDFKDENGEGSKGWRWVWGREESGGKRGFGGGELIGQALVGGHLMDELVELGDIENGG